MRDRNVPPTRPPTYTATEVTEIFKGEVAPVHLQKWDESGIFRPSFYAKSESPSGLLTQGERDKKIASLGRSRGDPHRAYTYMDLAWLRIFLFVKQGLKERGTKSPARRAADIVAAIHALGYQSPPHAARLLFVGAQVYLVDSERVPRCLTPGNQLPITQLFTDEIVAELDGRIRVLVQHQHIRGISDPTSPAAPPSAESDAVVRRR